MLRQAKPVATVLRALQKRLLSSTPRLRSEATGAPVLHEIPGDAKRRTLDPTKRQAETESPYGGHSQYNPAPPGVCNI